MPFRVSQPHKTAHGAPGVLRLGDVPERLPTERFTMFGRRFTMALLAVIALTLGACTATQTGGSTAPSAQAPTPIATAESSPTASAEESEEPTASEDASAEDYPLDAAENADVGPFLTGEGGMTLYYFTNDTKGNGKSVCNGECAAAWPPYVLEGDDELAP